MVKLKEITLGSNHTINVGDFQSIRSNFIATFSFTDEDLIEVEVLLEKLRDYVVINDLEEQLKMVSMVERRDDKTLKVLKKRIRNEMEIIVEKYSHLKYPHLEGGEDVNFLDLNHFLKGDKNE